MKLMPATFIYFAALSCKYCGKPSACQPLLGSLTNKSSSKTEFFTLGGGEGGLGGEGGPGGGVGPGVGPSSHLHHDAGQFGIGLQLQFLLHQSSEALGSIEWHMTFPRTADAKTDNTTKEARNIQLLHRYT
mmetsp:Transcript_117861/g.184174  ORF Transcript_117861/g.184174 Transcript_117861/m.184174 type:complete len:131 (+) Transcript_117861:1591-1983(+)